MRRSLLYVILIAGLGVVAWLLSGASWPIGLFVGRFHSLLVHFPIVLVLLAALVGLYRPRQVDSVRRRTLRVLLAGAFGSASAAALSGYLLSYEGGFAENVVEWHLRFGLLVALSSLAALLLHAFQSIDGRGWMAGSYRISLAVMATAVVVTGHLGGTLAHGPDYLTEYLPPQLKTLLPGSEEGPQRGSLNPASGVFDGLIEPVLEARCLECHSETRRKGGLSLASAHGINEGGDGGPIVVPGDSLASELVRRITLPAGDEDRMPPGSRDPLEIGEIERIRWWIDTGASADLTIAEAGDVPFPVQIYLDRIGVGGPGEHRAVDLPTVDAAQLQALEEMGFVVSSVAEGSALLSVRLPSGRLFDSVSADALRPVSTHIIWLDFSGVSIQGEAAPFFSTLENATRISLAQSDIRDGDLIHLSELTSLDYLNLYGTEIGDAGLAHLSGLGTLRSLYLWQTRASEEGVSTLVRQLPKCRVNVGTGGTDGVLADVQGQSARD